MPVSNLLLVSSLRTVIATAAIAVAVGPHIASAQDGATLPTVQLPAELDRVLRDYENAWRARDAGALAALFHPEGFVLSPGSPPVRGRQAIQNHYRNAGGPLSLRAVGYGAQDTVAYIVGAFRAVAEGEGGKFLLALRRASPRLPTAAPPLSPPAHRLSTTSPESPARGGDRGPGVHATGDRRMGRRRPHLRPHDQRGRIVLGR